MWKHNNTADWLSKKGGKDQARILQAAQRDGKMMRKEYKDAEKSEKEKMKKNMEEIERQKAEKSLKLQEEKSDILDALISQGGVCRTQERLTELFKKGKLQDLKLQVKYRKVILGQKGLKMTGSKRQLFEVLSKCIEQEIQTGQSSSCS